MSDIVKQDSQLPELANVNPADFLGEIDSKDIIIPRAKKIEAMSPEMSEDLGLKPGDIINSINKTKLPEVFIPIKFFKTWIRWNANKPGERGWVDEKGPRELIYRTMDKRDPRLETDAQWIDDAPPLATEYLNYLALFEGQERPIIVSFGGTNYKAGKELLNLIMDSMTYPFANSYKLVTVKKQNDMGTWFQFNVKKNDSVDLDTQRKCVKINDQYGTNLDAVKIHEEADSSSDQKAPF